MLLFVSILKLVAEIAVLALAGQWLLGKLAGPKRESNFFYQIFDIVTRPVVKGTRVVTPQVVIDRHVPLVAFLILVFVWIFATLTKISICVKIGVQQCQ